MRDTTKVENGSARENSQSRSETTKRRDITTEIDGCTVCRGGLNVSGYVVYYPIHNASIANLSVVTARARTVSAR